jgi:hypothetical protein
MVLHLVALAIVLLMLVVAFGLLLRASEPVWATAPAHKADHPGDLLDLSEIDWEWP